jgi:hypothetical protein
LTYSAGVFVTRRLPEVAISVDQPDGTTIVVSDCSMISGPSS